MPRATVALFVLATSVVANTCGGKSPTTPSPPPGNITIGLTCGVERWAVKTLSDSTAATVNVVNVQQTTVRDLNLFVPHCSGLPQARTYSQEFQVYEVVGRITVARLEDDRDYHIAIADAADPGFTIVTEVADPVCQGVVSSPFLQTLTRARAEWDVLRAGQSLASLVGTEVRVRGVGFYDFNHGQTGRSQSCLEIHPILSIERVQ